MISCKNIPKTKV